VHPNSHRDRAVLFDREAERYDRARPGYPPELIEAVLGPAPQGARILDVACGTGIASRQLAGRGATVLGVELNPGMAAVAARHGIEVEVGAFETWDPRGRSFDVVTCAQAWHWLDPQTAIPKAAAVLRQHGRLCLFWSIGFHPEPLDSALQEAYRRAIPPGSAEPVVGYGASTPADTTLGVDTVVDVLRASADLGDPRIEWFPWTRTYTRDMWLDEILTHSDHIALDPDVRERVVAEIGATLDAHGGGFEMPYRSVLVSATRR
jgi:SAM-dependent methyltransferase